MVRKTITFDDADKTRIAAREEGASVMNSEPEFPTVPLRIKFAALWAALMSCYIYGDYFELFQPGQLTKMISGHTDIGLVSQAVLLVFAILLSMPALMIFLSLVLPRNVCRWVSILLALVQVLFNSFAMQGSWLFYRYMMVVDILVSLTIIWYAARWPSTDPE
jgi:hypothetical protein